MRAITLNAPRSTHAVLLLGHTQILFSNGKIAGASDGRRWLVISPVPSLMTRKHINRWCRFSNQEQLEDPMFSMQAHDFILNALTGATQMTAPQPVDPSQIDGIQQQEDEELEELAEEADEPDFDDEDDDGDSHDFDQDEEDEMDNDTDDDDTESGTPR